MKKEEETKVVGIAYVEKKEVISKITSDFGREDLNALRDAVNALIRCQK